jgi:hypothetical protein
MTNSFASKLSSWIVNTIRNTQNPYEGKQLSELEDMSKCTKLPFILHRVLSVKYQKLQEWWRFNSQFQFYSFYLFLFLASISITITFPSISNNSFNFTSPFPQWESVAASFSNAFQQSQGTVTKPTIDLPGVTFKFENHPLSVLMRGNYGISRNCGGDSSHFRELHFNQILKSIQIRL